MGCAHKKEEPCHQAINKPEGESQLGIDKAILVKSLSDYQKQRRELLLGAATAVFAAISSCALFIALFTKINDETLFSKFFYYSFSAIFLGSIILFSFVFIATIKKIREINKKINNTIKLFTI